MSGIVINVKIKSWSKIPNIIMRKIKTQLQQEIPGTFCRRRDRSL